MAQIYEGMFVLDNEVVREGWSAAKQTVLDLIKKHGGDVQTARHWGERKLAYKIKGRSRATYLLAYYTMPGDSLPGFVRDLDLNEMVLRYLFLKTDVVAEGEVEAAEKETESDFTVPDPPRDEVGTYSLWAEEEEEAPTRSRTATAPKADESDDDSDDSADSDDKTDDQEDK